MCGRYVTPRTNLLSIGADVPLREIERGLMYLSLAEISAKDHELPDLHSHPTDYVGIWMDTTRLGRVLVAFRRVQHKRHKHVHVFWTACKVEREGNGSPPEHAEAILLPCGPTAGG